MTYITHAIGGGAAGMGLIHMLGVTEPQVAAYMAAGAVLGSLLPDIDHTNSKISRKSAGTKAASGILTIFFKHRGFLHTPVFAGIAAAGVYVLVSKFMQDISPVYAMEAVFAGMISHLVLDTLNPGGIMWLWPLSRKRIHIAAIKTNGIAEKLFACAFSICIGLMLWR